MGLPGKKGNATVTFDHRNSTFRARKRHDAETTDMLASHWSTCVSRTAG
ncbi:hypothetical protein AB5I41_31605 [Sphingomonas sp. MMS24-JH45]